MIERLSLVEHKPDADRQAVEMPPHIFVKSFEVLKTCTVFICSDDHTRFGQRKENLIDTLRVLCLEEMMVGKSQGSNRPTLFFRSASICKGEAMPVSNNTFLPHNGEPESASGSASLGKTGTGAS